MIIFKSQKLLALILVIFTGFLVSACSTIDGAGRDIESVGEKIQE